MESENLSLIPGIYAEDTEDIQATAQVVCDRKERCVNGGPLPPGYKRYPVHSFTGKTRLVCKPCFEEKRAMPTTMMVPVHDALSVIPGATAPKLTPTQMKTIQVQTNAAQRSDESGTRVRALPTHAKTPANPPMQPPPVPARAIYVPKNMATASLTTGPQTPAYGYSPAHHHYAAARDSLSRLAYRGVSHETIDIVAQLLYEVTGKVKPRLAFNIREGIPRVPARIGGQELKQIVYARLYPPYLLASGGLEIKIEDLKFREVGTWEDLDHANPVENAIYERFEVKDKKNNIVFKPPGKTGFQVALVISPAQWVAIEDHQGKLEFEALQKQDAKLKATQSAAHASTPRVDYPVESHATEPAPGRLTSTVEWSRPDTSTSSTCEDMIMETTVIEKRQRTISQAAPNQRTPPPNKKRALAPTWHSPDPKVLREVLEKQTQAVVTQSAGDVHHQMDFFPIIPRPFQSLLAHFPRADFTGPNFAGALKCQTQKRLGEPGSLKSAHPGQMTLFAQAQHNLNTLGASAAEFVAVKRVFYTRPDTPAQLFRYPVDDEIRMIEQEGNSLYWAMSLMDLVYSFVDSFSDDPTDLRPRPHIPRTRFVKAGMAKLYGGDGRMCSAVLLEEYIDEKQGDFRKFIHNTSAIPLVAPGHYDHPLAQFLCFAQHVQWEKTRGQAYLADFQGGDTLLSDPQVMTHPALKSVFSHGNIGSAFAAFPEQHKCNYFCVWFHFNAPTPFSPTLCSSSVSTD